MIDALINCTTKKTKELSCLKEFHLKFYRFYKKIQLANLEKVISIFSVKAMIAPSKQKYKDIYRKGDSSIR